MKPIREITIVGLGLIGGSLGMALKKSRPEIRIIGVDLSQETINEAISKKVIDEGAIQVEQGVETADLVILATPVGAMLSTVHKMLPCLKEGAILTDVGSTKEYIVHKMAEILPPTVHFIGGHPMAGSEKWGLTGASELLFENAAYVLTPLPHTPYQIIDVMRDILGSVGAQMIILSPEEHDRKVAAVSHLPHLIACALVNTVGAREEEEKGYFTLAAGGFRDTTRIAASQSSLWSDILLGNHQVLPLLEEFLGRLREFERTLQTRDPQQLNNLLTSARLWREKVPTGMKGILPRLFELQVSIPDQPGSIADITHLLGSQHINIIDIEIQRAREEDEGTIRLGFSKEVWRDQAKEILEGNGYLVR